MHNLEKASSSRLIWNIQQNTQLISPPKTDTQMRPDLGVSILLTNVTPQVQSCHLRADACKYQPEVCNSEKFKILKKIHNIAHGKLLQEIHVLLRSDNYF